MRKEIEAHLKELYKNIEDARKKLSELRNQAFEKSNYRGLDDLLNVEYSLGLVSADIIRNLERGKF